MERITIEKAKLLPTPRLLAYYKRYGNKWKAKYYCECCGEPLWEIGWGDQEQYSKQYNEENSYWNSMKKILNTREHVKTKK